MMGAVGHEMEQLIQAAFLGEHTLFMGFSRGGKP